MLKRIVQHLHLNYHHRSSRQFVYTYREKYLVNRPKEAIRIKFHTQQFQNMESDLSESGKTLDGDHSIREENKKNSDWPWKRARKAAVMISFSGKDHLGMQRNNPYPTIEEDLLKALKSSGAIAPEWYDKPQLAHFQRASRTDKGVSAVKMVVSLKIALKEDIDGEAGSGIKQTIKNIQAHLPQSPRSIQINDIRRVTKNFNCKSACDFRTYEYLIPTFAFHQAAILPPPSKNNEEGIETSVTKDLEKDEVDINPIENLDKYTQIQNEEWTSKDIESAFKAHENFRIDSDLIKNVNEVFKKFIGSHYYHNYTSGKLPLEPSSLRYITEFEMSDPFLYSVINNDKAKESSGRELQFSVIKVKGQSFMLHQIRKMIGMVIAVVRGDADESVITDSWNTDRIDIPRAPGLGLMLEEVHYEKYNQRFGKDGIHEPLEWTTSKSQVERFKKEMVFEDILGTEANERSMLLWLRNLRIHSFTPRHFENINPSHFDDFRVNNLTTDLKSMDQSGFEAQEQTSKLDSAEYSKNSNVAYLEMEPTSKKQRLD